MRTRKLVFMAILIALEIVLTRLVSLMTPSNVTRISLSFMVYGFSGYLMGVVFTGLMATISDLVGAILFPPPGGFYFGFTLSTLVSGAIFGLFYKSKQPQKRVFLVLLLNTFIVDFGFNTLWITLMTKSFFTAILIQRLPGILINLVLRFLILIPMMKRLPHLNLEKTYEN